MPPIAVMVRYATCFHTLKIEAVCQSYEFSSLVSRILHDLCEIDYCWVDNCNK